MKRLVGISILKEEYEVELQGQRDKLQFMINNVSSISDYEAFKNDLADIITKINILQGEVNVLQNIEDELSS